MSPGSKNNTKKAEQQRLAARGSNLRLRSNIIQSIRRFFFGRNYLEIETPHLIPAPAPEVHIDAIRAGSGFLHTSPELCMKRLLAAGYPRIFQISKCFRHGERGDMHLNEFTLLEWYRAGISYRDLMDECEEMIGEVSRELGIGKAIHYQGNVIDIERPWNRISLRKAFKNLTAVSLKKAIESGRFEELLVREIEPHLGIHKPTFLYDYPASHAALSRLKKNDPDIAERFEFYMGGLEVANAFSELTNASEQEARFDKEQEKRRALGKEVYPMPKKFLKALSKMPQSAGIALGIDRLVMVFANTARIDDVVTFTPEEL